MDGPRRLHKSCLTWQLSHTLHCRATANVFACTQQLSRRMVRRRTQIDHACASASTHVNRRLDRNCAVWREAAHGSRLSSQGRLMDHLWDKLLQHRRKHKHMDALVLTCGNAGIGRQNKSPAVWFTKRLIRTELSKSLAISAHNSTHIAVRVCKAAEIAGLNSGRSLLKSSNLHHPVGIWPDQSASASRRKGRELWLGCAPLS